MTEPNVEDLAAMREQGDLLPYLLALTGRTATPKPAPVVAASADLPGYRIAHKGGWPIGTAATGPTPTHGRCTCPKCEQAAVVALPAPADRRDGQAA
ncbi:hypothetical protein [Streptomyces sp. NPDC058466]|uniref:hypothetical protein n=1 Tax=Streptomyces sp. NPDC058466 TaxID=3346512 RepID=UPI003658DB03